MLISQRIQKTYIKQYECSENRAEQLYGWVGKNYGTASHHKSSSKNLSLTYCSIPRSFTNCDHVLGFHST